MHYAIVDIETTGGYANQAGITEIAIIVTDGKSILHQYQTLINPQQKIPYYITKLTGINDAMVANAPLFEEVAEKIYNLLKDSIFVAHNVNFDYSFVNASLKANNYHLHNKKLCTVRYGKKVFAGLPSYSLGNFCKKLGIPVYDRHRAGGDCMATYHLLKMLLANDTNDVLEKLLKNKQSEKNLPLQVEANNYKQLPNSIGVYYFLDKKEKIIYIGKAKNIKKRVASHFAGNKTSKQRQEFIRNIAHIKYTIVATELMSLILESTEIKKYWPKYNQSQKYFEPQYALYQYTDQLGYLRLCVDKKKKHLPHIATVASKTAGLITLRKLVIAYNLCPYKSSVAYIAAETNHCNCNNSCTQYTSFTTYNNAVKNAVASLNAAKENFFIIDEGLQQNEKSIIQVAAGNFTAMGYATFENKKIDTTQLQQLPYNNYINTLVMQYAKNNTAQLFYTN